MKDIFLNVLEAGLQGSVIIALVLILRLVLKTAPRIYVPAENSYVLAHERAHIRRGDHWFKLLGFAALALHWFNPLVWAAYLLLCRDLEMACDEAVVRDMDLTERKAYSAALLACAAQRSAIAACPVAFGEVSVKQRIVSVLNYRRPRFWIFVITRQKPLLVFGFS